MRDDPRTRANDEPIAATGPLVTVVIPVLNGARVLADCLEALRRQIDAPATETIVVDNGSTDSSAELARSSPVVDRVLVETERGPYAARNAGIAAARGTIIAFTDADCIPEPRWLAAGVEALEAGADVVGGRVEQIASATPSVWERYDRATYLKQDEYIRIERFAATANLFVRADLFRRLGPFVPALVASGDLEFGRRVTEAGYQLVYGPQAAVRHRPRTTFSDMWALHRKLGSGFAELARFGIWPAPWKDLSLRISLGQVWKRIAADGPPLRRRQFAHVHAVAMLARWTGRLTGRG